MWKLLKGKRGHLYMVRKGDSFVKFANDEPALSHLGIHRILNPYNIRMSTDPYSWRTVHSKEWTDTGYEAETLQEIYEMFDMVQLMED